MSGKQPQQPARECETPVVEQGHPRTTCASQTPTTSTSAATTAVCTAVQCGMPAFQAYWSPAVECSTTTRQKLCNGLVRWVPNPFSTSKLIAQFPVSGPAGFARNTRRPIAVDAPNNVLLIEHARRRRSSRCRSTTRPRPASAPIRPGTSARRHRRRPQQVPSTMLHEVQNKERKKTNIGTEPRSRSGSQARRPQPAATTRWWGRQRVDAVWTTLVRYEYPGYHTTSLRTTASLKTGCGVSPVHKHPWKYP